MEPTQGNPDTPRGVSSEPPSTPDKLGDSLQSNSAYCRQVYINSSALVREPGVPTIPTPFDDAESQVSAYMRRVPRNNPLRCRFRFPFARREYQPNGQFL